MTELTITPDYGKKRLKFAGTVAAGEHVAVTVSGAWGWVKPNLSSETQTLRLRVMHGDRTVAVFPKPPEDSTSTAQASGLNEWTQSGQADAACELSLNTIQCEKCLKAGGNCLWLLEDAENHTLYGTGEFEVEPWPKVVPLDEPYDLDRYPDFVMEMEAAWEEYKAAVDGELDAQDASIAALEASKADATDLTAHTERRDNPHSVTKAQVGLGNVDNTSDAEKPISEAMAVAILAARSYAAGLAATEETRARAAESALEAGKADAEDTYTKDEVDAAISAASPADYGVVKERVLANASAITDIEGKIPSAASSSNKLVDQQSMDGAIATAKNGRFVKVTSLPQTGEAMVIYLVPREDEDEGNVYDEYIWTNGEWENFGSTDIDLSGYVPTTRKVNNKALSADISLDASDVGALPDDYVIAPSASADDSGMAADAYYTYLALFAKEDAANKTTSLSPQSTDTQYPSAKAVYDAIQQGGGQTDIGLSVVDGLINVTFEE